MRRITFSYKFHTQKYILTFLQIRRQFLLEEEKKHILEDVESAFWKTICHDWAFGRKILLISAFHGPLATAGESASAWQRRWEPSNGPESQSRTVYAKFESNSEPEGPEYAREWQWEPVRARVGVTGSHREPERDRERSSKSQREPVKAWERLVSHF